MAVRVRTLEQAAAWVEEVGVALLFPNGDYILPSLWEATSGSPEVDWGVQTEEGKWVFTPEMARVWSWKDELPAHRLACVGLHVARTSSLVAPGLVAALYALTEESRATLEGLERELADAAHGLGRPATRRELRLLVGADKRLADRAVNALQRKLVLTNAGLDTEGSGWGATLHDLFARRWKQRLRRVPPREEAVAALSAAVLRGAGELSAADLAAALRLRRREATETLERLETEGLAAPLRRDDLPLWTPAGRGSRARSRAAGSRSSPRRSR
jgi:DNA-binding MarR family transcriptional regulator